MNKNIRIKKYTSHQELAFAVANRCEYQLKTALSKNDNASFIVPGGTTPAPVFEQLSHAPLDWSKITIGLSDERWLAPDHPQSNQRLISETLRTNKAEHAKFFPMKNSCTTAFEGEANCNSEYKQFHTPFSLTMLGMGTDGHFASLFPNSKPFEQAINPNNRQTCVAIDATGCPVAGDYPKRMSLTLSAILNSELIILLITGEEKLLVIEQAIENNNPLVTPVSALVNQTKTPVEIYWSE